MEIEQKKWFNRSRYTFEAERLTCAQGDQSRSVTFVVNYADIPLDTQAIEERQSWLRHAALIFTFLAAVQLGLGFVMVVPEFWAISFALTGLFCSLMHRFLVTRFTAIKTDSGFIRIICDAKHDTIIEEVMTRRRKQMLLWYGEIDYTNDPGEEIRKFHWLKSQGVIGEDEFESIRNRIEVFHSPMQEPDFMEGPSIN
ncbi:MAG: hypothetical protein MI742_15660 [Desulfobacterales bacterium]|nr:hypothetical protein [Desulfobacterales bacterium]